MPLRKIDDAGADDNAEGHGRRILPRAERETDDATDGETEGHTYKHDPKARPGQRGGAPS